MPPKEHIWDRFWKYVDKEASACGCWVWTGPLNNKGYGNVSVNGKAEKAHRVSYAMHNPGGIPEDKVILHACDNRQCVNPAHLSLGSQSENIQDAIAKGRIRDSNDTVCINGHSLEGDNLYIVPRTGKRQCRECKRTAGRKHSKRPTL